MELNFSVPRHLPTTRHHFYKSGVTRKCWLSSVPQPPSSVHYFPAIQPFAVLRSQSTGWHAKKAYTHKGTFTNQCVHSSLPPALAEEVIIFSVECRRPSHGCKQFPRYCGDRILAPYNYCHHPWYVGHKSYHKALLIIFGCDRIITNGRSITVFKMSELV